jgi:hypothetical protein
MDFPGGAAALPEGVLAGVQRDSLADASGRRAAPVDGGRGAKNPSRQTDEVVATPVDGSGNGPRLGGSTASKGSNKTPPLVKEGGVPGRPAPARSGREVERTDPRMVKSVSLRSEGGPHPSLLPTDQLLEKLRKTLSVVSGDLGDDGSQAGPQGANGQTRSRAPSAVE